MASCEKNPAIISIMVVGFHYKRGCQVEYVYPPNDECTLSEADNEIVLPEKWKNLPSLAMPDGAHHYDEDTIYFHLPSLDDKNSCVYCVACFRQSREKDAARGVIQKSVVVLSRVPLYGYIQATMKVITASYFDKGDFKNIQLINSTYEQLNEQLKKLVLDECQVFLDLSARDLITRFQTKLLVLFKLILLEKRVLFFSGPVHRLSSTILSLLSLFPEMIESGLSRCLTLSEELTHTSIDSETQFVKIQKKTQTTQLDLVVEEKCDQSQSDMFVIKKRKYPNSRLNDCASTEPMIAFNSGMNIEEEMTEALNEIHEKYKKEEDEKSIFNQMQKSMSQTFSSLASGVINLVEGNIEDGEVCDESNICVTVSDLSLGKIRNKDDNGCPLEVFGDGNVCFPYASLYMLQLLDRNATPQISSFVVGATNKLFLQQHKKWSDVLVDLSPLDEQKPSGVKIEIYDPLLKKQCNLSTEDLKFADNLCKTVIQEDSTSYEGGEEWIRYQFRSYLLSLMYTARNIASDETASSNHNNHANMNHGTQRGVDSFNSTFIAAWKKTRNYKVWSEFLDDKAKKGIRIEFPNRHPAPGDIGLGDIRKMASYAIANSDLGKGGYATGKYVMESSRKLVSKLTDKMSGGAASK